MQFLVSSCAFYALMGVGSQVAASYLGVHPDIFDAMRDVNVDQGSLWSLPLLASLAFAITQADRFEFLGEVRDIFKVGVLPSLAPLGLPGDASYRHGPREVWLRPAASTNATLCDGSGEDPRCSDSLTAADLRPAHHTSYLGYDAGLCVS